MFTKDTKVSLTTTLLNIAACCILAMAAFSHAETFYKWKDDNGIWVYGAHPPADREAIEIRTTVSRKSEASEPTAEQSTEEQQTPAESQLEYTVEAKLSDEQRSEYCATARTNLEALSSNAVIRRRDAEGNVVVVSDQERQEEIDKAKLAIEQYC